MADLRPTMPIDGNVRIEGPVEYAVGEGDPPLLVTVRRSGDIGGPARASLAVLSAPGHRADISINPQEISFAPGQDGVTTEISIVDDSVVEPTETVEIDLRNPWRLESAGTPIKITITDNDEPPTPPPPPPPSSSGSGSLGLATLSLLVLSAMVRLRRRVAPEGLNH